jgi:hypothetical protein
MFKEGKYQHPSRRMASLVLGGIIAISMGAETDWRLKVGLIFIPMIAYGVMLLMVGRNFPVNERVTAGVSFREMLAEAGIIGALIVVALMIRELGRVFGWSDTFQIVAIVVIIGAYGAYVRSLGRPMFIFLVLIMIPLATTELGTDTWITDLMQTQMTPPATCGAGPWFTPLHYDGTAVLRRFHRSKSLH